MNVARQRCLLTIFVLCAVPAFALAGIQGSRSLHQLSAGDSGSSRRSELPASAARRVEGNRDPILDGQPTTHGLFLLMRALIDHDGSRDDQHVVLSGPDLDPVAID